MDMEAYYGMCSLLGFLLTSYFFNVACTYRMTNSIFVSEIVKHMMRKEQIPFRMAQIFGFKGDTICATINAHLVFVSSLTRFQKIIVSLSLMSDLMKFIV